MLVPQSVMGQSLHGSASHDVQARARKAEMTTKLEELQRDIERLDQISDQQVADEEAAVRKLTEVNPQVDN